MNIMKKNKGIHIIGNLKKCDLSDIATNEDSMNALRDNVSKLVKDNDLTDLGSYYHFFGKNSFTGVIALAESHVAFHTWPEFDFVSLDIYVCNYSKDHKENAERLFEILSVDVFKSKDVIKKIINR